MSSVILVFPPDNKDYDLLYETPEADDYPKKAILFCEVCVNHWWINTGDNWIVAHDPDVPAEYKTIALLHT